MIEAAEAVREFVSGRTIADLNQNRMLLFALLRAIEVLGEAASKISVEARTASDGVPWRQIVATRNRLIHGYFDIDHAIIWKTATEEIPDLLTQLRLLIGNA